MYKPLPLRQKKILLKEFRNLESVNSKFDFWEKKLGLKYIEYLLSLEEFIRQFRNQDLAGKLKDLKDFEIQNSKDERHKFNTLVLEEYISHCKINSIDTDIIEAKDRAIHFDTLIANAKDKIAYIKREINQIEFQIAHNNSYRKNHNDNFNNFFVLGYEDYFFNKKNNYLDISCNLTQLITFINGRNVAIFKTYLEEELSTTLKKIKNKTQIKEITIAQQFLILHYLGVLKKVKEHGNATKTANFLSPLFHRGNKGVKEHINTPDPETQNISIKEKRKIKEDLEVILPLFEGINLKEEVNNIKNDIKELDL